MFNIKAKIGEKSYSLVISSEDVTIETLKNDLQTQSNIEQSLQKWIYQGKILSDKSSVKECNLKEESCVIVIKSAQPQQSDLSTPSTTNIQTTSISHVTVNTSGFDRAIHLLLDNSSQVVEEAVNLLVKITSNIISNPNEEKYRRLSCTNATFVKKIGSVKGGLPCMEGLGFHLQGENWVLIPSAEAWEALVQVKIKLEKFVVKLKSMNTLTSPCSESAETNTIPTLAATLTSSSSNSVAESSTSSVLPIASTANISPEIVLMHQLIQALQIQNPVSNTNVAPQSNFSSESSAPDPKTTSPNNFAPTYNTLIQTWQSIKFGDTLMTKAGMRPTLEALAGKKLIGLYFSAHWCPPCRGFTPLLSEFYSDMVAMDFSSIEIIFISSDRDEGTFNQYWSEQPWATIPWFNQNFMKSTLSMEYHINGIPSLVILDASTGVVKDSNARDTISRARGDTNRVLTQWLS